VRVSTVLCALPPQIYQSLDDACAPRDRRPGRRHDTVHIASRQLLRAVSSPQGGMPVDDALRTEHSPNGKSSLDKSALASTREGPLRFSGAWVSVFFVSTSAAEPSRATHFSHPTSQRPSHRHAPRHRKTTWSPSGTRSWISPRRTPPPSFCLFVSLELTVAQHPPEHACQQCPHLLARATARCGEHQGRHGPLSGNPGAQTAFPCRAC
jgi:hypothetical protein